MTKKTYDNMTINERRNLLGQYIEYLPELKSRILKLEDSMNDHVHNGMELLCKLFQIEYDVTYHAWPKIDFEYSKVHFDYDIDMFNKRTLENYFDSFSDADYRILEINKSCIVEYKILDFDIAKGHKSFNSRFFLQGHKKIIPVDIEWIDYLQKSYHERSDNKIKLYDFLSKVFSDAQSYLIEKLHEDYYNWLVFEYEMDWKYFGTIDKNEQDGLLKIAKVDSLSKLEIDVTV